MNGDICLPDKSQIAREILTYLAKNPDAQDTLEGITRGWLSGGGAEYKPALVREVLKDLVLEGTILESEAPAPDTVYQLNAAKRVKMNELILKHSLPGER